MAAAVTNAAKAPESETPPKPVQRWSASDYARNGRFVHELAGPIFAMLGPRPGERILDLGCGDGTLTAEIKAAGADVLGVDLSDELLAVARMKGLTVRKLDGHALDFASEFDAVFSNAALHWMRAPQLVIAGVAQALKPGGRLVVWDTKTSGARWIWELSPDGTGTRVVHRRPVPRGLTPVGFVFAKAFLGGVGGHADELEVGMAQSVARLKAAVENPAAD